MPFHNPYHFVPATGRVRRDGQEKAVETQSYQAIAAGTSDHPARHDRWVPGTHSGRIVCQLTLERPTLVGRAQLPPADDTPNGAKRVQPYETTWRDAAGKDHIWPGFPGSSLRGMVGAVAEAISQSSLRVLEDRAYSVRVNLNEGKALSALGRLVEREQRAADGSRFDLVPVGLPTLETQGSTFDLKGANQRWSKVFSAFAWDQVLTAYVNGYAQGVSASPGSFLQTENPDSFNPASPSYYYALLAKNRVFYHRTPTQESLDSRLEDSAGGGCPALYIKAAGNNKQFLLGRRLHRLYTTAEWGQLPPVEHELCVRGYLRVLGIEGRADDMPHTKKHEIFIPDPQDKPQPRLPIPQHVIDTFETIGQERVRESQDHRHPFALKGIDHWQAHDGDLVYFDVDDAGKITEIAVSAVWRRKLGDRRTPGMQSAYDFFDALAPAHLLTPLRPKPKQGTSRTGLTPAELLLGVVDDGKSDDAASARALASRVRVFDAVAFKAPKTAVHAITLKTLSSPKPPSPALYFQPRTGPAAYIPKGELNKDSHRPNGRKFYLHHRKEDLTAGNPEHWTCTTQARDGRDHLRLSCRPLLPDPANPFWFHIDFDNLSDAELTLLVSALQPDHAYRHKLGLGKSLGLGSVRVEIAGVFLVDRASRYGPQALDQARYTSGWLPTAAGAAAPAWAARYPRESAAASGAPASGWPIGTGLHQQSWWNPRLIDETTLDVLVTLGDPTKLQPGAPVHTPLTDRQRQGNAPQQEKETFKWFEANAKPGGHETLTPVVPGQPLPTLSYL